MDNHQKSNSVDKNLAKDFVESNKENISPTNNNLVGVKKKNNQINVLQNSSRQVDSDSNRNKSLKPTPSFEEVYTVLTAKDDLTKINEDSTFEQRKKCSGFSIHNMPSSSSNIFSASGESFNFEEILSKMLTPDLISPERQSNYTTYKNFSQNSNINPQNMTFEEMLNRLLAKDIPLQRDSSLNENYISQNSQKCKKIVHFATVSERNENSKEPIIAEDVPVQIDSPNQKCLSDSHPQKKNPDRISPPASVSKINENTPSKPQISFFPKHNCDENISHNTGGGTNFHHLFVPSLPLERPTVKEICTQTSFDESSTNLQSNRTLRSESRNAPKSSTVCDNIAIDDEFCKRYQNGFILQILSRNVTSSFFDNIDKIGTIDWVRSALQDVNREIPFPNTDIVEHENTFDMYADDLIRRDITFCQKGPWKIYKIFKNDRTHSNYNIRDECDTQTCLQNSNREIELEQFFLQNSNEEVQFERNLVAAIDDTCNNQDLIIKDDDCKVIDKSKVRIKIHDIFAKLCEAFQNKKCPRLVMKTCTRKRCIFKDSRYRYLSTYKIQSQFTLKHKRNRYSFCRLLFILGKIYTLLECNTKVTKRELFYQCKPVFENQRRMDCVVDTASRVLGLGPWNFNIISPSGIVYGNLKIIFSSGETSNCNVPGTAIPHDLEDIVEIHSLATFILVVEKEAIFHKLLEEDLPNKLGRPFIMISGKGVPSFNTRLFLKKLSNVLALPVFILVDPDIYGIKIMMTYRFGSQKGCYLTDQLAVPTARWLGIFPSEMKQYGMPQQNLNQRDKSVINGVLKYPVIDSYPQIAKEIKILLDTNKKGSIEGMMKNNIFLSKTYLPSKFFNKNFI